MTKPNLQIKQQQVKKLAELGAYLRQFRYEQSMTLEEVAAKTKIQTRLLNAIEEGRFEQLPEPVYVQGFIRLYADALGLDGAQFATAFPTELSLHTAKRHSWRELPAAQLRPIHLYVLYLVLIVSAVSGLSYLVKRPSSELAGNNAALLQSDGFQSFYRAEFPSSPSTNKSAIPIPGEIPGASVTNQKSVQVGVTLTAQSWLRVVVDGKTEYEGILDQGTQRSWSADKQLVLRAGNAGAVLVALNNGQAKQLGAPGVVEEITFSSTSKSANVPRDLLKPAHSSLSNNASTF
jgi:transcriptional regulator with XRE-family HTH domain